MITDSETHMSTVAVLMHGFKLISSRGQLIGKTETRVELVLTKHCSHEHKLKQTAAMDTTCC